MTVRLYALLPLICMVGMGAVMWFAWRYAGKDVRGADQEQEVRRECTEAGVQRDSAGTGADRAR